MSNSVFNSGSVINIDVIKKQCEKYEYISFDVFDTLIKRNVSIPQNIFVIMSNEAKKFNIKNFCQDRLNVEKKMRESTSYITIHDIYNEYSKMVGIECANKLKMLEINLEKSYCQKNYEIFELYKYFKNQNKKIIAISDMYLTKDIISEILEKEGIEVNNIYVSCECKTKKGNGSLFTYALEKEKIDKSKLIHIGDQFRADYIGARKVGIKSLHIKKDANYFNVKKFINKINDKNAYSNYLSVINNNIFIEKNYYTKFGFSMLGPLIYNYCYWLKSECVEKSIETIFFFSRDGYILKQAFDILFPNEFKTKYIYFSRRSIRIPYISIQSTYEDIMKFFPKTKMLTMKVYFENFGLNPQKYKSLIDKYNLTLDGNILYKDLFNDDRFKKIFDEIYDDILVESNKEYRVLKKYLKQENFKGKIAVVDIGWHNSMQYYIENIAKYNNLDVDMYGFYLGRSKDEKKVSFTKSFIIDNPNCEYVESVLSFIGLIESFFLSNEGSTKTYVENNHQIKPILYDYEYKKEDLEYNAFVDIKNGILDFINIVSKLPYYDCFNLDGYDAFIPLKEFGINPYLKDVSFFSKFRYLSEEIVYFSNAKSKLYYLIHPNALKNDLYKARWKIGFMKEIMKIKLPYYGIYKKMKG